MKQDEKIFPARDTFKEQPVWKKDNGLFVIEFKCLH